MTRVEVDAMATSRWPRVVGVLRDDLCDVDRVLSSGGAYGLVTAALLAIFGVTSLWGGRAVGDSRVATAAAAAACALAVHPARHRLRRAVDRRLHPLRQSTLAAIEDLPRRTMAICTGPPAFPTRSRRCACWTQWRGCERGTGRCCEAAVSQADSQLALPQVRHAC